MPESVNTRRRFDPDATAPLVEAAARMHGWGTLERVASGSAGAFIGDTVFVRAVPCDHDSTNTLAIASVLAHHARAPRPLMREPLTTSDPGVVLEVYEALGASRRSISFEQLGAELAHLHATPLPDTPPLRPFRRLALSRRALEESTHWIRPEVLDLFDRAERALTTAGPHVLCHGDVHAGNILDVEGRWHWVDLEVAGLAPAGMDLGASVVHHARLHGPDAARDLARGYLKAGGTVNLADALLLGRVRDLCALGEMAMCTTDTALLDRRLASLLDGTCSRGWPEW